VRRFDDVKLTFDRQYPIVRKPVLDSVVTARVRSPEHVTGRGPTTPKLIRLGPRVEEPLGARADGPPRRG
jgi:hypothetical protein